MMLSWRWWWHGGGVAPRGPQGVALEHRPGMCEMSMPDDDQHTLRMVRMRSADVGQIICMASNGLGSDSCILTLEMAGKRNSLSLVSLSLSLPLLFSFIPPILSLFPSLSSSPLFLLFSLLLASTWYLVWYKIMCVGLMDFGGVYMFYNSVTVLIPLPPPLLAPPKCPPRLSPSWRTWMCRRERPLAS